MSELALWILGGRTTTYGFWPADMRDERLVLCHGDLLSDPDDETLFLEPVPQDGSKLYRRFKLASPLQLRGRPYMAMPHGELNAEEQ